MAATSDDIEIDLDDLDPATAKKTAKVDDEPPIEVAEPKKAPKKERINPDEGIAKLQKDLAEARAAQEAAERRAQQASIAEVKAKTEVQGTQLDLVKNAITQFTSNKDALKAKYAAAAEAGDWLAAAEVQSEMATCAAKLESLELKKSQLERAPKPAPSVTADPVEQLASQLSPKSAEWVRAHPEFARDQQKRARMERAHQDAIDDGFVPDTDDYFAYVEDRLKITRVDPNAQGDALSEAARPKSTRSAPPASAPVTRSGNGAAPRTNIVTLTPEEREAAKNMDMSDVEYARQKLAIQRGGLN